MKLTLIANNQLKRPDVMKNNSQQFNKKTVGKENVNMNNKVPSQKTKPEKKYASQYLEEQLSGISGFSASDAEDNESFDMKQGSKDYEEESSEEEEQTESDASEEEEEMPPKGRSHMERAIQRPQTAYAKEQNTRSDNFATFNYKGLERQREIYAIIVSIRCKS